MTTQKQVPLRLVGLSQGSLYRIAVLEPFQSTFKVDSLAARLLYNRVDQFEPSQLVRI